LRDAPQHLGRAGGELARERLARYQRYADLVAEQERALDAEDMLRFEEVADDIARLRADIGAPGTGAPVADGDVQAAADALRSALATNRRIQGRLSTLRREKASLIKNVSRRRPQTRRYLADADEAPPAHVVDVKF
jgi:hypothetical protein